MPLKLPLPTSGNADAQLLIAITEFVTGPTHKSHLIILLTSLTGNRISPFCSRPFLIAPRPTRPQRRLAAPTHTYASVSVCEYILYIS